MGVTWLAPTYMALGILIGVSIFLRLRLTGLQGAGVWAIIIGGYIFFAAAFRGYENPFVILGCAAIALAVSWKAFCFRRIEFAFAALVSMAAWLALSVSLFKPHAPRPTIALIAFGIPLAAWVLSFIVAFIRQQSALTSKEK